MIYLPRELLSVVSRSCCPSHWSRLALLQL